MVERLLQLLSVTCSHRKTSQPFAAASSLRASRSDSDWDEPTPAGSHYVVCLDCGRKFEYDWDRMKIVR
jgi:hypothetical protein